LSPSGYFHGLLYIFSVPSIPDRLDRLFNKNFLDFQKEISVRKFEHEKKSESLGTFDRKDSGNSKLSTKRNAPSSSEKKKVKQSSTMQVLPMPNFSNVRKQLSLDMSVLHSNAALQKASVPSLSTERARVYF
jgi:hypothetical protein